ncbi:KilA-N domain-containing protein [Erwinia sp. JH02]|uniref:KilA-N domain-containing protein n=1 Tax=Erwinia sp. JH02 TaxID=2733394 RepID=UPI0014881F99|nr:KilA-N domain-containing protein [Erwinia sp. JH02]NNS07325.1 KilA-N domain-containing protein [Erwinia sp. JH02]
MTHPTVIVNGVSVRVDSDGRYSLNDLHAAAVLKGEATESQRPGNFIKSAQIKRFAAELSEATNVASVKAVKGGLQSGVWGLELIAIRYAAWLSPKFEIRVYNTFREAVLNGIGNMTRLNRLDLLIANETKEVSACARKMNQWGVGGRKRMLNGTRENLLEQMDPDMVSLMEGKAA